jgi:hypothetical protein
MGVPPTGRRVTVTDIDIYRVVDGRFVEYWQELDTLGMLRQVGAVPWGRSRPSSTALLADRIETDGWTPGNAWISDGARG